MQRIKKVRKHFLQLTKAVGVRFAIKACIYMVLDGITKHRYMYYIKCLRRYVRYYFNDEIGRFKNLLIEEEECEFTKKHLFIDKTPIWICWLQGEKNMPQIVKVCYENLLAKIHGDMAEVTLITLDNYLDYIDIPEEVLKKVEEKTYSLTNMSDLLRCILLATYGGMWIDSTVYVGCPIEKEILEAPFFSPKTKDDFFVKRFATESRWASWLMSCQQDLILFRFVSRMLMYYMVNSNVMLDYYLMDYIIELAYEEFPEVKAAIDAVPLNNKRAFEFITMLNEPYNKERIQQFLLNNQFNKLSYSYRNYDRLPNGEYTNYYHFIRS